jgi:PadR family transcriptional regulator PadR
LGSNVNICRLWPVPRLPNTSPQTLLVLAQLLADAETWCYGYDLSRRTGLKSGTLYPILVRLAEHGWLETNWAAPETPGRPPRHLYRLTAEGRALRQWPSLANPAVGRSCARGQVRPVGER